IEVAVAIAKAIEIAEPLIDERAHTLLVHVPQTGLLVDADSGRLSQVFANLLTNSARYTAPGGRIDIRAGLDHQDVYIDVVDSGIGLSPEFLPKVFDLFVQGARSADRSQGGLGLGLALVQNLVKLHGGSVSAHSEGLGEGSRFRVRLPLTERASGASPEDDRALSAGASMAGVSSRRILLVDDNADAVDMLREMLVALGFEVLVAYDGPQALLALESFDADVAVVDIDLPLMDGYELAQRIRTGPRQRVPRLIAMTGYGQAADRVRTHDAGFGDHLVKPVDVTALIDSFRGFTMSGGPGADTHRAM
ncbi:MAG TPA: ATP-binding protein, partial [Vicinamibacterales bacterium]|nr:ATP-binding protein [Vicinamibacterales bacterium]